MNSPETPLFHKGHNLYNGAAARQAVHDGAQMIVVEGYVDVIAMVTAGYPATVAPLGTALTEEQLGLIWKMADEPVLCFDGDNAGRRAAYRTLDMALPRLTPGKSVQFALLPEGQDPDDLVRSGGREAVAEVLAGARSLADMLWTRETEASALDTPERRAALEARVREIIRGIGDETVRRYYNDDFMVRLRQLMAPKADARPATRYGNGFTPRRPAGGRGWQNSSARNRSPRQRAAAAAERAADRKLRSCAAISARCRRARRCCCSPSSIIRGCWKTTPRSSPSSTSSARRPTGCAARCSTPGPGSISAGSRRIRSDCGPRSSSLAQTLPASKARSPTARTGRRGPAPRPTTSPNGGPIVVTLHRKKRTLNRELKDAEHALGEEPTDANLAWLRDVQARLSALDGFEAQIEGFGASSGRAVGNI